jgi:hypothetical protein
MKGRRLIIDTTVGSPQFSLDCILKEIYCQLLKYSLKVLSSEMEPNEIRLKRGAEGFWKNPPAPHPTRTLQNIRVPPCFLIANYTTV